MSQVIQIIYEVLAVINLIGTAATAYLFFKGSKKAPPPWNTLKLALCVNMIIMGGLYIFIVFDVYVEPMFIRLSTTLLISSLFVQAYFGARGHDTGRHQGDRNNR